MTDSVLKSIMRLFAIIGSLRKEDHVNPNSDNYTLIREITESYLGQLVNPDQSHKYLQMFEFHYKNLQKKKITNAVKKISLFSVKTLLICEQVNEKLDIKQKIFVILQLLDVLNVNGEIYDEAHEFIKTTSDSFGIKEQDFEYLKLFVIGINDSDYFNRSFMIIDGQPENNNYAHHIFRENLLGHIKFYYSEIIESYFFKHERYDDELYINGRQVLYERIYLFEKGSAIRCPKIHTLHYSDIVGSFLHFTIQNPVQLLGLDIEYTFKNSENGIKRFNFLGKSGQLIGIMGGSGVGKTTLLSLLNGTLKPHSGQILVNGIDIYENKEKVKGIIGYIPQDDFLIEELTVFQNLYFNAKFCFCSLTEYEIKLRVDKILLDFGLFDIRNLTVGSALNKYISGGQRKRLNIALELLREPAILFVDEPTSGLSSRDSENVMELFKKQTFKGKLVVINIHQPSSDIFKMFDCLLILDKGGRPVYFGNASESVTYFKTASQMVNASESECIWCGNLNPEQLFQIIEAKEINSKGNATGNRLVTPQEWYQLYMNNLDYNFKVKIENSVPAKNIFKLPSRAKQFILYGIRNFLTKISDHQYLIINLLEAPVLALILGFMTRYSFGNSTNAGAYIFSENVNLPAYIFMSIVVSLFLGMMVSGEEIIRDAKLLKREMFLNLSRLSYLNSKVVFLFSISALQAILYVLIGNFILGIKDMTFTYWLILFSTSCFANILGLNISSALKSVVAIYILIPLLLIPQLLLSGIIVKYDKLNNFLKSEIYVPVIGDIMASRWAYEAIATEQFKANNYQKLFFDIEKLESEATYYTNYLIPKLNNMLDGCEVHLEMDDKEAFLNKNLPILAAEIKKIETILNIKPFFLIESISTKKFTLVVATETKLYLKKARAISSRMLDKAIETKDRQIISYRKKYNNLSALKDEYHNHALADQVLNKEETEKIKLWNNVLYRKYEPIYMNPQSVTGRSHFYAAVKFIGNYEMSTFWFNFMVLWIMTFLLYLTLVFKVFSLIIAFFNNIKFFKRNNYLL